MECFKILKYRHSILTWSKLIVFEVEGLKLVMGQVQTNTSSHVHRLSLAGVRVTQFHRKQLKRTIIPWVVDWLFVDNNTNNWIRVGMDVHNMIKTLTKSLSFLNPIIVIIIVKIITKHLKKKWSEGKTLFTVTKMTLTLPYSSSAQCDIYCCQTGWPAWPSVCFIDAWLFISF